MRILIVTQEYRDVTVQRGGIGAVFSVLAGELAADGHEMHVLTVTDGPSRQMERDGVQLHLVKSPVSRHRFHVLQETLWTFTAARAVRRLGRFDVILVSDWGADALAYMVRGRRTAGPVIVQLHTSLTQLREVVPEMKLTLDWKLRYAVQSRLERAQAKRADAILGCSQAVLDWARELWAIDSIPAEVLPNLVRVDEIRRVADRGELPDGWPTDGGPVVAFAGRMEILKGPHVLIAAMSALWDEYPDTNLVLMGDDSGYGDGMMSSHLRKVAGSHADRLHLLPHQPADRLFAALKQADIVALPSFWENFGMVALETMAIGSALIATWGNGFQEFIRDGQNGLLVPSGDPEALAAALRLLLGDDDLRGRIGAAAGATAEDYDAPVVTRRYVEFFERVASRAS